MTEQHMKLRNIQNQIIEAAMYFLQSAVRTKDIDKLARPWRQIAFCKQILPYASDTSQSYLRQAQENF